MPKYIKEGDKIIVIVLAMKVQTLCVKEPFTNAASVFTLYLSVYQVIQVF